MNKTSLHIFKFRLVTKIKFQMPFLLYTVHMVLNSITMFSK